MLALKDWEAGLNLVKSFPLFQYSPFLGVYRAMVAHCGNMFCQGECLNPACLGDSFAEFTEAEDNHVVHFGEVQASSSGSGSGYEPDSESLGHKVGEQVRSASSLSSSSSAVVTSAADRRNPSIDHLPLSSDFKAPSWRSLALSGPLAEAPYPDSPREEQAESSDSSAQPMMFEMDPEYRPTAPTPVSHGSPLQHQSHLAYRPFNLVSSQQSSTRKRSQSQTQPRPASVSEAHRGRSREPRPLGYSVDPPSQIYASELPTALRQPPAQPRTPPQPRWLPGHDLYASPEQMHDLFRPSSPTPLATGPSRLFPPWNLSTTEGEHASHDPLAFPDIPLHLLYPGPESKMDKAKRLLRDSVSWFLRSNALPEALPPRRRGAMLTPPCDSFDRYFPSIHRSGSVDSFATASSEVGESDVSTNSNAEERPRIRTWEGFFKNAWADFTRWTGCALARFFASPHPFLRRTLFLGFVAAGFYFGDTEIIHCATKLVHSSLFD